MMQLYSYYRSSAAYRVRIALNIKGLHYGILPVNLLQQEQCGEAYRQRNPQGLLPALVTEDGEVLNQSVAILEWLEESYPEPALLPSAPLARARVRALVNTVACEMHPLLNLSVLHYLRDELAADAAAVQQWYAPWIARGFDAIEPVLKNAAGDFAVGNQLSFADCCLVPQVYNARRFGVPVDDYPTLCRVVAHCEALPAFHAAAPAQQVDAPERS